MKGFQEKSFAKHTTGRRKNDRQFNEKRSEHRLHRGRNICGQEVNEKKIQCHELAGRCN